jgi:type III secretion protein L
MSYHVLFPGPALSVLADNLVVPAADAPALADALSLAQRLQTLLDGEAARLQAAEKSGHAAGYAQGLADGARSAQATGAQALARTVSQVLAQSQAQQAELRDAVLTVSLLIVRRVAAQLGPQALLQALITQALDQLCNDGLASGNAPDTLVLRLHPSWLAAVREQMALATRGLAVDWRADDSLGPMDCVIDTPQGRLLAGLPAQLERVQTALQQADRATSVSTAVTVT